MKITLHWTAGNIKASAFDLSKYHFVIDKNGRHHNSEGLTPIDNLNCYDGAYVPHCKGCNTENIGIAIAGYKDYQTIPEREAFEALFKLSAELMFAYKIPLDEVKTHAERDVKRKIDIDYLPDYWGGGETKGVKDCADFIRGKVDWYYRQLVK